MYRNTLHCIVTGRAGRAGRGAQGTGCAAREREGAR